MSPRVWLGSKPRASQYEMETMPTAPNGILETLTVVAYKVIKTQYIFFDIAKDRRRS
jgi:hypothetical protein